MNRQKKEEYLQWHPAFYAGMQIELKEEADNLIFENERQLGTKPLEIIRINWKSIWRNTAITIL